ncbi:adenine nucleotide alpha hydrolases-like protein [Mytilinidion resinicola]|uniref:Adenine nucleotide alpha hydrolases-like protein n=1 Tax=Mytilinidion resinicola TaxID=574789 RepID=A0A6A6Z0Y9_9PEZI|nr:adenine nucleotide alpha hydrolases-like protein [Mytilinidion resinicola]KAF2813825.1 adenine nucleotide alpha hydrolases-like protein [Mytilinidion resinicola]
MGESPTPSPTSAPAGVLKASPQAAAVSASTRLPVSPLLLAAAGDETHDARRPSIQFIPHIQVGLPQGLPKSGRLQRRMSSPPPPPLFRPRVSFDTFDRPADFIEENSFTLITKHKDYEYTKRSRTFLCGLDSNDYSEYALQWLIDELVDDGDEIVCLRVVEMDSKVAADSSIENGKYRKEAEQLMKHIQTKNDDNKAINLILEFSLGKVNKVIDEMINLYEPAILVVGTRGRSLGGFQGLLPGSVSKYCLQHSPVPVIVVRPSTKRDKAKQKRKADGRHAYKDILDKAAPMTGHILNMSHRNSFIEEENLPASDDEAGAVAAAIGYKPSRGETIHPLAHVQSAPGNLDSPELRGEHNGDVSPDDFRSPGVVMKSPHLQNLDSPPLSDDSSSDDENGPEGGVPMDPEDSPDESAKPAASRAAERHSVAFVEPDDLPTRS